MKAARVVKPANVSVGSWQDQEAKTGCTVILFDRQVPTVVDVRGGAPGTRETDLLDPGRLVGAADAIFLSGGSAFGLDAAGGVMRFLHEQGRGTATNAGPVPIVPSAILFDLGVGSPVWPSPDNAFEACQSAQSLETMARGQVGAGTGATTGKLWPPIEPRRGGLGFGSVSIGDGFVAAIAAVNSAGMVIESPEGLATARQLRRAMVDALPEGGSREATTLVSVLVGVPAGYDILRRVAVSAHDAMARTILPSHTLVDGDVVFASGLVERSYDKLMALPIAMAAEIAVESAIHDAVSA